MAQFYIFTIFMVSSIPQFSAHEDSDFTYIGRSSLSRYFLSNSNEKRSVSDARFGCEDVFKDGQLVTLETTEEHNEIKRLLSAWGVTDSDRVWTSGVHDGYSNKWVWYDYYKGTTTPIENACERREWLNNFCPTSGCLAIGGLNSTYKWQSDFCSATRRYLCEYPDEGVSNRS